MARRVIAGGEGRRIGRQLPLFARTPPPLTAPSVCARRRRRHRSSRRVYNNIIRATTTSRHGLCSAVD